MSDRPEQERTEGLSSSDLAREDRLATAFGPVPAGNGPFRAFQEQQRWGHGQEQQGRPRTGVLTPPPAPAATPAAFDLDMTRVEDEPLVVLVKECGYSRA